MQTQLWLVQLLFVDDPHGSTSAEEWQAALERADAELGIADPDIAAAGPVLWPAGL